jgi:hypothetical protein
MTRCLSTNNRRTLVGSALAGRFDPMFTFGIASFSVQGFGIGHQAQVRVMCLRLVVWMHVLAEPGSDELLKWPREKVGELVVRTHDATVVLAARADQSDPCGAARERIGCHRDRSSRPIIAADARTLSSEGG